VSTSLYCIASAPAGALDKLAKAGISTIHDLVRTGASPSRRHDLADDTKVSRAELYSLVKQADLLRIDGLTPEQAVQLVGSGIRSVADLAACTPAKVSANLAEGEQPQPTVADIARWKAIAGTLKPVVTVEPGDPPPAALGEPGQFSGAALRDEMFTDMVDMVVNLGRGIAIAQQEMDEQAIRTQKEINTDPKLRGMGLTASWFTIPDATFNLKLNYSISREESSTSAAGKSKFLVTPANARSQNYFKLNEGMQSELSIKFASVPPPPQVSQPIVVPTLIGKTLDEAKTVLADAGLLAGTVKVVAGAPAAGKESEIADQLPTAGSDARFQDRVTLFIRRAQPA